jgi:RHS repeat-associated protein
LPYTHTYTVVATQSLAMNRSVEATDRAGNLGNSPLFRVAQDAGGPQLSTPDLAASVNDPGYVYLAPGAPALYYAPAAEGELSVTVTATDTQSGLKSLTFPDVFAPGDGDERSLAGQHGPETFQHSYPFLGSQAVSGTFVVSATDQVDVPGQAQPFRVVQDAISPTAAITVPAVVPLEFQVAWGGQDSLSGVRHYDVQYRDALTPTWTAWLSGTAETQAPFSGERGHGYAFRVRATDHVSNTGAWTESLSVTVSAVTKYYYHGGTRVAMRQGDVVYYLHSDHLGSTSLTTDQTGALVAQTRYRPYGEERWTAGGAVSDYTFTGQRADSYIKLMEMGARWYDPQVGRWISPDSIIPDLANPQSLNRYSYVYNRPTVYIDEEGHLPIIPLLLVLGGAALLCTSSNPLPPDQQPPDWQGLLGLGLLFGAGAVLAAPELTSAGAAAACVDGDCTNEMKNVGDAVSKFGPSGAAALENFANEATVVQAERGLQSFGQTWKMWAQMASQSESIANDLFVYRVGDKVMGAMKIASRVNSKAVEVVHIEGLGEGVGTKLMQTAVRESLARGYGGRIILHASDQAMKFYEKLGGVLVDPKTNEFFFSEQAAQALLEMVP